MFRYIIFFLNISLLVPVVHAAPTLDEAAKKGNVGALRAQLSTGADINKRYDIGRSALMIAARYGKQNAVEELVQAGADLNLQDNNGDTALHLAGVYMHRPVAAILLRNGADFRIRNNAKLTAQEAVERFTISPRSDPDMIAMADYLAKTIPTLPTPQSNTGTPGAVKPVAKKAVDEPALFVEYVTLNVEKFNATPATLQQVANIALLKRGWTVLKSEPGRSTGSYTRKEIEYRVEILSLPDNKVRIAFLNGYHNTNPGYLKNLEKDMLLELELQHARKQTVPRS